MYRNMYTTCRCMLTVLLDNYVINFTRYWWHTKTDHIWECYIKPSLLDSF